MYSAKITIHTSVKYPHASFLNGHMDYQELFGTLCAALYQNGQISSRQRVDFIENNYLCSMVSLADKDALDERYFNAYMDKYLPYIHARQIYFDILSKDDSDDDNDDLSHSKNLVLFTSFNSIISPVRSLDSFKPIPLYHLPKTHDD